MGVLAGLALLVLLIPMMAGAAADSEWRPRWARQVSRPVTLDLAGQGAFRTAPVRTSAVVSEREHAPWELWFMAFTCWGLAQMMVPWLLAGCGLLVVAVDPSDEFRGGDQLFALPFAAWSFANAYGSALLWRAGSSLVRGACGHADDATRRARKVILVCHAPVVVACLVGQAFAMDSPAPLALAFCSAVFPAHAYVVRAAFVAHRDEFPLP